MFRRKGIVTAKEDDEAVQHDRNQVLKGLVCQVNSEIYLGSKDEIFKHRVGITEFKLERSPWKPGERKSEEETGGRKVSP